MRQTFSMPQHTEMLWYSYGLRSVKNLTTDRYEPRDHNEKKRRRVFYVTESDSGADTKKMITQVNVTSLHCESTILIMENSQMIRNFGSKLTVKVVIVLLIKNV